MKAAICFAVGFALVWVVLAILFVSGVLYSGGAS